MLGKKIKVLFAASEMAPMAKVGGLGDVIGSLPKALKKMGVGAEVAIPRYEHISKKNLKLIFRLDKDTAVYQTRSGGVRVFLIDNKKYLSHGPVYFERTAFAGSRKYINRFLFFSKAVFELIERGFLKPDVVHANDWHTGALVSLLKRNFQTPKVVFTIHNLANQGKWGGRNLMAEGIKNADIVTTVSRAYAKEILTKEYGEKLEGLLHQRARENKLIGILNGIDYSFWPMEARAPRFGASNASPNPRFGFVARLTFQKGLSVLLPVVPYFVKKYGAKFYFLGQGEARFEKKLKELTREYPRNVFVKIGFDEALARRIYANSDFFLMPSFFEPSGLGQMIAMRYGAIPIARKTGGLSDTIYDGRTGFLFAEKTQSALKKAIERAIGIFKNKKKFKMMQKTCKKQNFGWEKSARLYKRLYTALKYEYGKGGQGTYRGLF